MLSPWCLEYTVLLLLASRIAVFRIKPTLNQKNLTCRLAMPTTELQAGMEKAPTAARVRLTCRLAMPTTELQAGTEKAPTAARVRQT